MKIAVTFLSAWTLAAVAGPPTWEIDTRTSAFSGRYRYEVRDRPDPRGRLELLVHFAPLAPDTKARATFGDLSYRVTAVSLTIDGKPQKFPPELVESLGFCSPEAVFFYTDGGDGLVMTLDFSAGKERTGFVFRIRNETVSPEPLQ
jgi:hypothetical protein